MRDNRGRKEKGVSGFVSLGKPGSVIQDNSDHGASKDRWIREQSGFIVFFDAPWAVWSRTTDPGQDDPNVTRLFVQKVLNGFQKSTICIKLNKQVKHIFMNHEFLLEKLELSCARVSHSGYSFYRTQKQAPTGKCGLGQHFQDRGHSFHYTDRPKPVNNLFFFPLSLSLFTHGEKLTQALVWPWSEIGKSGPR